MTGGHRLRRAARAAVYSTDEDSEEGLVRYKRKKTSIKSVKRHKADTTVLWQITWPHELVYRCSAVNQPSMVSSLYTPLHISIPCDSRVGEASTEGTHTQAFQ